MWTIGKLAKKARVSTDTIRFYERIGLLVPSSKTTSGYRLYGEDAVGRLAFVKHAQRCGFSLPEVRLLLDTSSPGSGVDSYRLALDKKTQIEDTIGALRTMARALSTYIGACGHNGVGPTTNSGGAAPILTAFVAHANDDGRGGHCDTRQAA